VGQKVLTRVADRLVRDLQWDEVTGFMVSSVLDSSDFNTLVLKLLGHLLHFGPGNPADCMAKNCSEWRLPTT
jgi:hypothetical protein